MAVFRNNPISILDDLRDSLAQMQGRPTYEPPTLYLTGAQLVEAYRQGILSPHDTSYRVLLSPEGHALVQEYLDSLGE